MIQTDRVLLRGWRDEDAVAHHLLCSDERIAATLGSAPTMADSQDVVRRQQALLATHGYCFWVLEYGGRFAGWCGIKPGKPPIDRETEIGWTVASHLWGQGLAYEAAEAVLGWAWANIDVPTIAATTAATNVRSRRLMERLGMTYCPDEGFDHPDLAPGDPLRAHVLYRAERPA